MAKLTIELDVPDAIMKIAMSEKSEEGLREMCQVICQEEFDKINRDFMVINLPFIDMVIKNIEERILSGKMELEENAPQLLKDIFNKVKDGKSNLKDEIEVHRDELVEWVVGKRKRETPTPFDCFEGLIKKD